MFISKAPVQSIKVMLELPMPAPAPPPIPQKKEESTAPSVEDRVKEAIDCIDSGHDSRIEWSLLTRLYKDLSNLKKPNDRARNLMKLIKPVLAKFGYFPGSKE